MELQARVYRQPLRQEYILLRRSAIVAHQAWYKGSEQNVSQMDYNVYHYTGCPEMLIDTLPEMKTFREWQRKMGHDFHSVVADPLFVDPEHDNYTLRENSPAFELGFQQIDMSIIGPRK